MLKYICLYEYDNLIIPNVNSVEATPSHNASEVRSTKTMINRVGEKYGMTPKSLMGDTHMEKQKC